MKTFPKRYISVAAVCLAALGAVPLAGCSVLAASGSHAQGYLVFDSKSEAVSEDSGDVPDWMPDDATAITIDLPGHGDGYLMKFHSADGVPASGACTADAKAAPLEPTVSASWWPKHPLTDDRRQCGDAEVAREDGTWYAWVQRS